jgi:hypothetical protein
LLLTFEQLGGIAVWLLAAVFAISGIAKLHRPIPAAVAMMNFGVLRSIRPEAARALGVAEISVAATLSLDLYVGLVVAAALLATFVALLVRALTQGRRFGCGCFSSVETPLSGWTLARTASLFALSLLALYAETSGGTQVDATTQTLEAMTAISTLSILLLGSRTTSLIRWNAIRLPEARRRTA